MHTLVIGCGSIGGRHLKNLRDLGVARISAVDLDRARLDALGREVPGLAMFTDMDKAIAARPDAAIVSMPTWLHVPAARALVAAGCHVMVEKPISHTAEGVPELVAEARAAGRVLMTAYSMRFHPGLRVVADVLASGRIGRPLAARAMCGQYLPDWHPWQDYRAFYMSKESQGGGAVLDISHEIDTLRRFFGEVSEVCAFVGKVSDLEMDADDLTVMVLRFAGGLVASVHLDLLARAYRRDLEIVGSEGTIRWDYTEGAVRVYTTVSKAWEDVPFEFDRNALYRQEVSTFLAACRGEGTVPVDGAGGLRTLEVVLAAKTSSRTGRSVRVGG